MSDSNIFYVYEHWRPDTNQCFYVGKGKDKRAWDLKNMRNRHYKAVVSKLLSLGLAVDIRIIIKDLSEDAALALEIDRISFYGIDNLTNMTSGGDGLKNPSKELREKISKSQKARFQRPEEIEKITRINRNKKVSDATRVKLSITSTGRKHTEETKQKMKEIAKKRGISQKTREAQKLTVTGKKRAPFSEETLKRMSEAAKIREQVKKEKRRAA